MKGLHHSSYVNTLAWATAVSTPPPGRRGRIPGAGKPRSSPHRYDSPCALSSWRWTWPAPPNSSAAALGLDHSRSLEENLTPLYW